MMIYVRRLMLFVSILALTAVPSLATPPKGDLFIPISARLIDTVGVGAGLGWQHRATGFIVMAEVTWDRLDGASGAVAVPDGRNRCHPPPPIPFATPSRGETGLTLTIGIPLRKVAHK